MIPGRRPAGALAACLQDLWVIQIAIANFRGERTVAWNLVEGIKM